jgi:DNA primase
LAIYIPEDTITAIKNATDIVEVVSEVVILKKTGQNHVGLCPFHAEKTPSFTVSSVKQIFHCFGCQTGGNVFNFVMRHHGLSFPEAARVLAARCGVEIPERELTPRQRRRSSEREALLAVNKRAAALYHQILLSEQAGKPAQRYLKRRGLTLQLIKDFRLGFAPDAWDTLTRNLQKKRHALSIAEKAGLVVRKKSAGRYYDRFRNRIIFPIFDRTDRVVALGGRVLDDSLPKYLNSPESPVYSKSRSLYGMQLARGPCRASGSVFVVEGYMDLLALHQYGIENAVATLGTALTAEHLRIIRGFAAEIVLVFDSDDAGLKAAERSVSLFIDADVDGRIVVLPRGHDPDTFLRESGTEAFRSAAEAARDLMTFMMDTAQAKHGATPQGRIRTLKELIGPLMAMRDNVARSIYIRELAERLNIDESVVLEKLRTGVSRATIGRRPVPLRPTAGAGPATDSVSGAAKNTMAATPPTDRLERQILAMMIQFPDIIPEILAAEVLEGFNDATLRDIGQDVVAQYHQSGSTAVKDMVDHMDEQHRAIVAELALRDDPWNLEGGRRLIAQFQRRRLQDDTLLASIRTAEQQNDDELLQELLVRKQQELRKRQSTT